MKKVLFIVAAAIAATFSMTSCVETTESASVTALREAKAEQLRALAEAERTRAAADSILAAAEAAWNLAQAEYEQARAEDLAFQTEMARAKFEARLEAILQEAQNRLLEAQKENQRLQNEMLTQTSGQLKELYTAYYSEVGTLNDLKEKLNTANIQLIRLENGLISAEQSNNSMIAIHERQIANYQAQIEAWQNYTGIDKADLDAEVERLWQERTNALNDRLLNTQQYQDALTAYNDYRNAKYSINNVGTESHDVVKAFRKLIDFTYYDYQVNYDNYLYLTCYSVSVDFDDPRFEYEYGYSLSATYYELPESEITRGIQTLQANIDYLEGILGTEAVTGADPKPATGLYLQLDDANKLLTEATNNKDQALIDQYTLQVQRLEELIAQYVEYLADAEKSLEDFNSLVTAISGDAYTAYVDEVKALGEGELAVAYFDAAALYLEAYELYNDINSQYSVAYSYANNYGILDVQEQIDILNSKIGDEQTSINNLKNNITNAEIALQNVQDNIADLTDRIAIQDEIVALALQAIDDFFAANGTPEE